MSNIVINNTLHNINKYLVEYYKVSAVRLNSWSHPVMEAGCGKESKPKKCWFTEKEIQLYFKEHNGVLVAKEIIIGGNERTAIVIY